MKQIFDSSFNLISFYTKTEFDSKFKYFLRKESKAKIVITNRISLFNKDDLLNFEIVNEIQNIDDIYNDLKNIKNETIIIDYYLSLLKNKKRRIFFDSLREISNSRNIKFLFINQSYNSVYNSNLSGIASSLIYVMDKIMIYNNNLIKIIKSRYDSDNELIDIKKYNNYIRKEKIKNIIKIES